MAYYDNGRPGGRPDYRRSDNRPQGGYDRNSQPRAAQTMDFPADYVDFAEKLMAGQSRNITTSKLRNLLSLLMDVYNVENLRTGSEISPDSALKLQMARIRMAYEYGRDRNTKEFMEAAHLLPWLKALGTSREKVLHYIHYMEAIVAYHRFFGGREN